MALSMKSRALTAGAAAPRVAARPARAAVVVASRGQDVSLVDRLAPSLLAALVTLSGAAAFDAVYAPAAHADDEIMSPYEKRQTELERRRELLREAREKAAARASGASEPAAAPAAAEAPAAPASDFSSRAAGLKKEASSAYEKAAKNRPSTPAPQSAESEEPSKPIFGGFNFSKPEPAPAPAAPAPAAPAPAAESEEPSPRKFGGFGFSKPKPAPEPAAPAPAAPAPAAAPSSSFSAAPDPWKSKSAPVAPAAVPAPAPAKIEVKKTEPAKPAKPTPAPVKAKSDLTANGKHRTHGFLPLWFAEILVLVSYVGLGLAATKYASQSEAVLKAAGQKIKGVYEAADKLVGNKFKGSSA